MAGFDSSNTDYTRRSHIVRVSEAGASGASGGTGGGGASGAGGTFVDIEVLDAIAFRIEGNKEVILDMSKPIPFRTDDTGDGNDNTDAGSLATRRSHMKRITSLDGTKFFDIEVIDAAAFRDQNGYEWILTMPTNDKDPEDFNSTDDTGNSTTATRRVHNELISQDLTDQKPTDYLKVVRNDVMSFRGPGNREVILVTPSNNDPNSTDPAAATFTTPPNYDPVAVAGSPPPAPDDTEPGVYFAFVDGSDGIFVNEDATIEMGPLWWIRKVGSGAILFVLVDYQINTTGATPIRPTVTLKMPYGVGHWDVLTSVTEPLPGKKPAPVVNPVTDGMLATLYQWTPVKPFETPQAQPNGNSQTFFFVANTYYPNVATAFYGVPPIPFPDKTNYNLSANLPDFFGSQSGDTILQVYYPSEMISGLSSATDRSYIAFWSNLGFDPVRLAALTQGGNPQFSNQADAEYVAAADVAYWNFMGGLALGNGVISAGKIVISQPGTGQLAGRAVFAMNLSQVIPAIQASAVAGQPPPPLQFELDIVLSAPVGTDKGDVSFATLGATAEAFKTLRDFPVDPSTGLPLFPFPDPSPKTAKDGKSDSTQIGAKNGQTISNKFIGAIDPKTFDIKFTVA